MSNSEFKGVIVPTGTPLTPDEAVDVGSLRRLVRFLINSGAHGIWAAGTTGEFGALEDDQRLLAIETIVAEVNGQVPVIANVSGPGTGIAIKLARSLQESGVDGIAATPPYYYNYDQGELISHYRSIHECSSIPLWVYNIPSTVKINVEPTTIAQLAAEGTIVGMKDSTGLGENLAQLVVLCQQGGIEMYRFLGSVFRTGMCKAVGGHGVIPGGANVYAASISKAWEAGEAGDELAVSKHMADVINVGRVMRVAKGGGPNSSTIAGVKTALKIMGVIDHDTVMRPMRPLEDEEKVQVHKILKEAQLIN